MNRFVVALLYGTVFVSRLGLAQESPTKPGSTPPPKEAFAENAPAPEATPNEAIFNAKQQRLREHYLETPIGDLPESRRGESSPRPNPTEVLPAGAEAATVNVLQNRALTDAETADITSTVCEPSIAVRGQEILYTGNWFASFSRNGGSTFQFRNPATMFPAIANRPFCCDQVALYVRSHDLMIWFLQHGRDTVGNTVRIAVAHGADIAAERWRLYDFTPQGVGNWPQEWFDYPDLAASNGFLFVTTNCFNFSNQFKRSVVLRIPLTELQAYAGLNYRYFDRTDVGSLRPTHGSGNVMYIGTHKNVGALRIISWPDATVNTQTKDFNVQTWVRGGASAPGPDGRDWLGFSDGRITAAWAAGGRQGFAWNSASAGTIPKPHVRVAIVDWNAGTVVSQPHIWTANHAYAYPGAAVNSLGQVGVTMTHGGGTRYPSHVVGWYTGSGWSLALTSTGTHGPESNRWGDYQSVRIDGQSPNTFAATGYSMSGGANRNSTVARMVRFQAANTPSSDSPNRSGAIAAVPREVTYGNGDSNPDSTEIRRKFSMTPKQGAKARTLSRSLRGLVDDRSTPLVVRTLDATRPRKATVNLGSDVNIDRYARFLTLPDVAKFFFEQPQTICLPDDRLQVMNTSTTPWSVNCQLIITFANGSQARGTGWLYGPRIVVTAGHCVHALV